MILKVCVVGSGASDEDQGTSGQTIAVPHGLPTLDLQLGLTRNSDDRSSCKSLKLCALYLLFRLSVELESTQVKMALPTLPGDWKELQLVRKTEKKTSKKQLVLQRGAESQCDQCQQAGRDTRGQFLFWVARVDEQDRRGPDHQQHPGEGRAGHECMHRQPARQGGAVFVFKVLTEIYWVLA